MHGTTIKIKVDVCMQNVPQTQTVMQDLNVEVSFNKFNSHTGFFN
jgi:hypothetical protein